MRETKKSERYIAIVCTIQCSGEPCSPIVSMVTLKRTVGALIGRPPWWNFMFYKNILMWWKLYVFLFQLIKIEKTQLLFIILDCFVFTHKTNGEHGSPLQYINNFVTFINLYATYIFCRYLRENEVLPYKLTVNFI